MSTLGEWEYRGRAELSAHIPRQQKGKDLTGRRFGRLRVARRVGSIARSGEALWGCACDCGNKIATTADALRNKKTFSCGCQKRETCGRPRGDVHPLIIEAMQRYLSGARKRKHSWQLTVHEFGRLATEPCIYCGTQGGNVVRGRTRCGKPEKFEYTGLDRVRNCQGYVHGNVVPCCKACNFAKHTMPVDEFFDWVERLAANKPWVRLADLRDDSEANYPKAA